MVGGTGPPGTTGNKGQLGEANTLKGLLAERGVPGSIGEKGALGAKGKCGFNLKTNETKPVAFDCNLRMFLIMILEHVELNYLFL